MDPGIKVAGEAAQAGGPRPRGRGRAGQEVRDRIVERVRLRVGRALRRRLLPLIALLVLGLAVAGYTTWRTLVETTEAIEGVFPVEMEVQAFEPQGDNVVLRLKEKQGGRALNVPLEQTEARVIAGERGLQIQGERPREYELMQALVGELGGRVDRVIIREAGRSPGGATVVLSSSGDTRAVQALPSDALALAIKAKAPIFVEDRLLQGSRAADGR